MTLRDRRKVNGYDEDVTPPPTAPRRGRGTGTPRGKVIAGPSTPLARKAVTGKLVSPPEADRTPSSFETPPPKNVDIDIDTPTASSTTSIQVDPATPLAHKAEPATRAIIPPSQPLADSGIGSSGEPSSQMQAAKAGPKIMLRFTRPTSIPPAELASLPSPITPLPPSQSTLYPLLPHLSASADQAHQHVTIDQRLAYRGGSESTATSEDYLSAREIRYTTDEDREVREATSSSNGTVETTSTSGPQVPGAYNIS